VTFAILTAQFIANTHLRRQIGNAQRAADVLGRGAAHSEDVDPMEYPFAQTDEAANGGPEATERLQKYAKAARQLKTELKKAAAGDARAATGEFSNSPI